MTNPNCTHASYQISADGHTLDCIGDWTMAGITAFEEQLKKIKQRLGEIKAIDGEKITHMDSAGALLLQNVIDAINQKGMQVKLNGFTERYLELLGMVGNQLELIRQPAWTPEMPNWFYSVGHWTVDKYEQLMHFLDFFGEFISVFFRNIFKPQHWQWRSTIASIDNTGYQALPIVALMSFLIGIVLVYQLAEQLRVYGADIFIVDVTGIAILREFAPLITSIIVAGRTATSFAALIGTMKVNEEVNALQTMGLSPMQRLVIPRVVGLVIALPLLVVWADVFGVLGSMVMAKHMVNIGFHAFLERFEYTVAVKHFVLGLIKAPVFAMIIAGMGCFQGFQVEMKAESVGHKTTKAAVQTIFLIIVADAVFSIMFSELGY